MEEAKRYKTEAAQRDAFVKICHDMRTPLSSVMHLAQILEIERTGRTGCGSVRQK